MLPADRGLLSGAGRWAGDSWDIPPPVPVGSGVPLASGTSHRRHGSTGAAWGLCTALDILHRSTVHSAYPELVWQRKDFQPLYIVQLIFPATIQTINTGVFTQLHNATEIAFLGKKTQHLMSTF